MFKLQVFASFTAGLLLLVCGRNIKNNHGPKAGAGSLSFLYDRRADGVHFVLPGITVYRHGKIFNRIGYEARTFGLYADAVQ
jgi:hypothetical protein|tara:strand:- start:59 stop:304 length:246 start_codon:yes stop_codon:yes gene_type:complete